MFVDLWVEFKLWNGLGRQQSNVQTFTNLSSILPGWVKILWEGSDKVDFDLAIVILIITNDDDK